MASDTQEDYASEAPERAKTSDELWSEARAADRAVILKAIAAVRNECGRIEKDGYNSFHKYSYVSESALVNATRPLMAKHGLVIIPSQAADYEPRVDECGVTHMIMEFTLAHESGAVWPEKARIFCSGNDRDSKGGYGDKGAYKANTGGYKYFLNRLFMVDTGDDPERGKDKAKAKSRAGSSSEQSSKAGSSSDATLPQLKKLGAQANEQAGKLMDIAEEEGISLDKFPTQGSIKDEIRRLAKERVGCGEVIQKKEVDPLLVAIAAAMVTKEGGFQIIPSAS